MVYILFSWIYISFISYSLGSFVHARIRKLSQSETNDISNFSLICISGLLISVLISTLLCLFIPLALAANGILFLMAIGCALLNRRDFRRFWRTNRSDLKKAPILVSLLFLLFLVIYCHLSLDPSSHYDDGLYYSTSVRWLQEYGTVKGLANINPRIAFNSSWLILQAIYGFSFLKAGLFNDLNGLMLVFVLIYGMGGMLKLIEGDRSLPTLMRALFMLPVIAFHRGTASEWMMFNINFLESCTADLPVCLLTWLIFILFLESAKDSSKASLVLLYSIVIVTMKLSALPILLLPLFLALRQKKISAVLFSAGIGILLFCPWIARNILISGYLIFPFSKLDLFHVAWKTPIKYVINYENAVMVAAADPSQPYGLPFTEPLMQWFPKWFHKITRFQLGFFGVTLLANVFFVLTGIVGILRKKTAYIRRNIFYFIFVISAVCGIGLWFFNGPDFRFGFGFIGIYCVFFLSTGLKYIFGKKTRVLGWVALMFAGCIGLGYYAREWVAANKVMLNRPLSYRMPQEMTDAEFANGMIIHLVKHEDSWNAPLPVANEAEFRGLRPQMLGKTIGEGFYSGDIAP